MDQKSLITPYILGEELRFKMRNHGLVTTDPVVDQVYSPTSGLKFDIRCGDAHVHLNLTMNDLMMSLDDFSERHIAPVVAFLLSDTER